MKRLVKNQQTVQTLLAAKKGHGDKQSEKNKDKPPPAKRLISDLSMDSSSELDISTIQSDLDTIKGGLEGVIKKDDLDNALMNLVQKKDIETLVTSIVTKLIDNMKKDIDDKLREKTNKQTEAIEKLAQENESLRELIANQRRTISDLKEKVDDNDRRCKQALEMGNYNEQYSRKFNIKVMNHPPTKDENLREIFVNDIVKDKLKVDIEPTDIQAIHRIPGKQGEHQPIIVKMVNTEVKTKVMKVKKSLPKDGVKLVDDVTKLNMGLINRLKQTERFESVYYFNCSVIGKLTSGTKIKFNLFDDVEQKLRGKT